MSKSSRTRTKNVDSQPITTDLTSRRRPRWIGVALLGVALAAGVIIWQRPWRQNSKSSAQPTPVQEQPGSQNDNAIFAQYAGSESCKACHAIEYDRWSKSHHGLAERQINPDIDKAAFDPTHPIHHGTQDSSAGFDGDQYRVITNDLSGKPQPQIVRRVIGVDPLRQFLVEFPGGRMQALELAYDPNRKDWFDVYGNEDRQPGEWGHWTGRGMNWNGQCAACHNTRVRKNYDEAKDSYHTRMAEVSVGCEACHGPMKQHVLESTDSTLKASGVRRVTSHLSSAQVIDTCGSCHARRGELTSDFVPGSSFFDHYTLTGVDESEIFYPDGQVHDEDYELSAFLGSKMHAAGVTCKDCHDVHSGKTILQGNDLCMRCHVGAFPKAPVINPLTHTFHKPNSTGSQCISCHMPQTAYMQRHNRHDHGFTIPDPLLTKQIAVPNACNRCHADKDADWALTAANNWYGAKMQRPSRQRALTIAAARKGQDSAKPALLALLNDPAQTFYWQSAFVRLLGQWADDPAVHGVLLAQLHAEHPMVRESAAIALGPQARQNREVADQILPLLKDSVRNVRVAAAHVMEGGLDPNSQATQDYLTCLEQQSDQQLGQLRLATLAVGHGDKAQAIGHLERAVQWDPRSAGLHREAAVLYGTLGEPLKALEQIKEAVRLEPNNAEFAMLYGLAANEAGKSDEALGALRKAVQLDARYGRAWYNLGMAERNAGSFDAALNAFKNAEALQPADPQIPYTTALLLHQLRRDDDARAAIQRCLRLKSDDQEARNLAEQLAQ